MGGRVRQRVLPVPVWFEPPAVVRRVSIGHVEKLTEAINTSAATARKGRVSVPVDEGEDHWGAECHTRQGDMDPGSDDKLGLGKLEKVSIRKLEGMVETWTTVHALVVDITKKDRIRLVIVHYFLWDQVGQSCPTMGNSINHKDVCFGPRRHESDVGIPC